MDPALPIIIQGPCYATLDGRTYYYEEGFTDKPDITTWRPKSDLYGGLNKRFLRKKQVLSGTPVGQLSLFTKVFPYAPTDIGKSIFGDSAKPLVIHTRTDTITYPRAAISKIPSLYLGPDKQILGAMEFTCIGDPATAPTDDAAWKTLDAASFTDTTFDETKILTDIYVATFGDAPYDAMGSVSGFTFDWDFTLEEIPYIEFGYGDIILSGIDPMVKFAPSNLSQPDFDALLNLQGDTVRLPGQSMATLGTDLVIDSDSFTATLKNAGVEGTTGAIYQTGKHRHQELVWSSKQTFTTGVANARWAFTIK